MWRNYLTVGLRSLIKNRTYTFINIVGLAIGMAACLMILLFVRYEMSYDSWLPNAGNVYQFQSWSRDPDTGEESKAQMSPYVSAEALKKDFPQVEAKVYGLANSPVFLKDGQAQALQDFLYVDGDFLDVVPLPLARGSADALARVDSAILSESEATKLFGTTDVVGRTLSIISRGVARDFRINAVFKDLPKNSHMRISIVARRDFPAFFVDQPDFLTCWGCHSGWVWVKLKDGSDPNAINAALPAWEKRNIPDQNAGDARFNAGDTQDWHLVAAQDVHLGEADVGQMTPTNDRRSIVTFAIIAMLILGMAIVNFTNLATARASQRAREVALRKVLGANRRQLVVQFIGESVLIAVFAMLIALTLLEVSTPSFAAFLDADIKVHYFGSNGILLPVVMLVLAVGILGGLYPAMFLSRFQPASVLKANKSSAETPGTGRLRSALVVGQFAVSIGLIICTAVIYAQTVYARTADPGYKRDHLMQVDELSRYQLLDKGETIVEQTRRVPGVRAVGRTTIGVATDNNNTTGVMVPGNPEPVSIGTYQVDHGFFDAMGLTLAAGRWFDLNRPGDDATVPFPPQDDAQIALARRGMTIVINELAANRLGFRRPADAVGKTLRAAMIDNKLGLVPVTIVGVVKNSRFRSIKLPIDALMFSQVKLGHTHMMVRFDGDPRAVRAGVERVWKGITNDVPFNAEFSDDIVQELYKAEDARAKTFAGFAVLAVIVACLGLFGLAAFTAERRTREIGVRKVLGARTRDIVKLLAWQFSKPVIVANLIAWPIA
ncbi:ABC transporter permease [Sphingosinicella sp. BN140058]|uniref:ABC transporter permease n=1 Tax=Sphingosinicella sp. BN140058 TaxID=1892855 RepID=UPI001FB0F9CD|nr:ABC transporter permease [Sphingosinicella sp. BN140058]